MGPPSYQLMSANAGASIVAVVVLGGIVAVVASGILDDMRPSPPLQTRAPPAPEQRPVPPTAVPPPLASAGTGAAATLEVTRPGHLPPTFDVVRVGARGTAVIAGRAAPGAEVVLLEDGREVARARADSRGEWVILPSDPLSPGARQFTLVARLGGEELVGADSVVVVVPEPPVPVAAVAAPGDGGRTDTQGPGGPVVVLVPPTQLPPRVLQGPAPAPQQGLALGQVDYDDAGAIRFAGTAAPNATVRLYVNDRHAGDVQADQQGRWALAPQEEVAIGRHRLRLDQLASAGAVSARIELPFQRDQLPEGMIPEGRVVVQPGHNLWRLARSTYGRGTQFTVIFEANREQIRNPNLIFPGQVFAVPATMPAEASRSR